MPEVLAAPDRGFPAILKYSAAEAEMDLEAAGRRLGAFVTEELHVHGAAVVKGLPIDSPEEFSRLMHATGLELQDYVGGVTKRPEVAPKVMPASGEDATVSMEPHNDNPYWKRPMLRLAIFCRRPPARGGQAQLTDGRAVLRELREKHPEVMEDLRQRKVRYLHFWPDAEAFEGVVINSWQAAYAPGCAAPSAAGARCDGRAAREAAEEALARNGHGFEWTEHGLHQWEVSDAIKIHPVTGEETWTNQLTAMHCTVFDNHPAYTDLNRPSNLSASEPCAMRGAMPYHTAFGDGEEFSVSLLEAARRAQWAHSVAFDYEPGDVVLIDNYLAMHGRFSFEGDRELYITLVGGPEGELL